jgi:hypothetical protein
MFFGDPGPCPICGAAQHGCTGDERNSDQVGKTRGVIIRQAAPAAVVAPTETVKEAPASPGPDTPRAPRRFGRQKHERA